MCITNKIESFKKKYDRLRIKYPSHLEYSDYGNFTIVDKDKLFKFFIRVDGDTFLATLVPQATTHLHKIQDTVQEQFYSSESLFKFIVKWYEDRGIQTFNPNSIKFILE